MADPWLAVAAFEYFPDFEAQSENPPNVGHPFYKGKPLQKSFLKSS